MDGVHMSMPMSDGEFDHVQTIDLDKGDHDRKVGNGTGLSSFTDKPKTHGGASNASTFKAGDSGSVNNLLNNDSDREVSDDEDSPAIFVGLKVEPSTGVSVESLRQLKETDNLMDNNDNDSNSSSIDDDLPPPESENSDNTGAFGENAAPPDDVTEM